MLCFVMLCYVIWLFVKRLSQEAIQRRSQRDWLVKIKVFKQRRDADDIPCNITLHSAGLTTAKARFWDREVRDQGKSLCMTVHIVKHPKSLLRLKTIA